MQTYNTAIAVVRSSDKPLGRRFDIHLDGTTGKQPAVDHMPVIAMLRAVLAITRDRRCPTRGLDNRNLTPYCSRQGKVGSVPRHPSSIPPTQVGTRSSRMTARRVPIWI